MTREELDQIRAINAELTKDEQTLRDLKKRAKTGALIPDALAEMSAKE